MKKFKEIIGKYLLKILGHGIHIEELYRKFGEIKKYNIGTYILKVHVQFELSENLLLPELKVKLSNDTRKVEI